MNLIRTVVLLLAASPAARGDHSHLRNLKKEKVCKALDVDGTQYYHPVDYPADCGDFVTGQTCFPQTCTGNFNVRAANVPVREQTGQGFLALAAWVEGAQYETLFCLDPKGYHFTYAPPTEDDPVERINVSGHILLFIYPPQYGIGPGAGDRISVPGVWWMQGGTISIDAENCKLVGPPEDATWECDDGLFTKVKGKFIDVCEYFEHGVMDHCMHNGEGECTSDDLCAWDDDQSGCYPDIY